MGVEEMFMSKRQNLGKEIASKIDECVRDCVTAAMEHIVSSAKSVKLSKSPLGSVGKTKSGSGKSAKKAPRKLSTRVNYELLTESVLEALRIVPSMEMSLKQIHEAVAIRSSTAQLRRSMHKLIESGKVEQRGDRRGARYSLVLSDPPAPAPEST
jgi:hypothetical protein